jgi:hypothetical protein
MKTLLTILSLLILIGCNQKENFIHDGQCIPMPSEWRQITGCDSIQLIEGGRARYNEQKNDFDVTWDSLYVNFCDANKFYIQKIKDTVFIHDTIYLKR